MNEIETVGVAGGISPQFDIDGDNNVESGVPLPVEAVGERPSFSSVRVCVGHVLPDDV